MTEQISQEELEQLRRSKERVGAYKVIFSTEKGKMVLADLAEEACFHRPLYSRHGINPNEILVNEGKRALFLYILSLLEMDFSEIEKVLLQAKSE